MKSLLLFLYRKKLSSFWSVKAILVITAEEECGLFGIESTRLIITEYIINNNTKESDIAHNTLNSCIKAKKITLSGLVRGRRDKMRMESGLDPVFSCLRE